MSALTWTASEDDASLHLAGRINEDADFTGIVELARSGPLTLHLGGIQQISSTGVREWILFMRELSSLENPVDLVHVAPTLVRQLNMIAHFAGSTTVRSVLLPYYCDACGNEQTTVLDLSGVSAIPSGEVCGACGKQAEFDDIASGYLNFTRVP